MQSGLWIYPRTHIILMPLFGLRPARPTLLGHKQAEAKRQWSDKQQAAKFSTTLFFIWKWCDADYATELTAATEPKQPTVQWRTESTQAPAGSIKKHQKNIYTCAYTHGSTTERRRCGPSVERHNNNHSRCSRWHGHWKSGVSPKNRLQDKLSAELG